jgi:single-strand DNA-binding protein
VASFNKIIIVGYLGRDPELTDGPDGTPLCTFSVATTERRRDRTGGTREITTWFRVILLGPLGSLAGTYLSKGAFVYIEGSLSEDVWIDHSGKRISSLNVRATDFVRLDQAITETCPEPKECILEDSHN